jgi:energy-coupling factor transporter ATP-binding protein EcfA2
MSTEPSGRRFTRLHLRNVRCFRDAEIELDPHVTVLIGENGSGKTTVMEALASLCYGEGEGLRKFPLTKETRSGEIALFEAGQKRPAAVWQTPDKPSRNRRLPRERHLFLYGRYRRVHFPEDADSDPRGPIPEQELDALANRADRGRTVTLFRPDNHLLRDLSRYLTVLHLGSRSSRRLETAWKQLGDSLSSLGQGLKGLQMERGRTGYIPMVVRNGILLELRELSDGYQSILVIVLDLILRYFYLFPSLENPLKAEAVVGIDEVDLHLHPRWQRTVVRQLVHLFPNTQFILTTHSAAVVQGAIDFRRRVITLREEKGGAVARMLSEKEMAELEGAEIGSVLLEEKLFGVDSRYSPKYSAVEERVDRIKGRMRRRTATDEERAELFEHLNTLQGLVVKDEIRRGDGPFMSQMSELRKAFLEDLAEEYKRIRG